MGRHTSWSRVDRTTTSTFQLRVTVNGTRCRGHLNKFPRLELDATRMTSWASASLLGRDGGQW
jgi:hypothetical protein